MAGRIVIFLALALYGLVLAAAIAQHAPNPPAPVKAASRFQPATQPMVPSANMHFLEHDHVILVAREDATNECAAAFIG